MIKCILDLIKTYNLIEKQFVCLKGITDDRQNTLRVIIKQVKKKYKKYLCNKAYIMAYNGYRLEEIKNELNFFRGLIK